MHIWKYHVRENPSCVVYVNIEEGCTICDAPGQQSSKNFTSGFYWLYNSVLVSQN